jgi:three-Cys-motif partner protein
MKKDWFEKPTPQSLKKITIVSKYFEAWSNVMINNARNRFDVRYTSSRLAYVDLFSGPGSYKDGTKSTPLLILDKASSKNDLRQMLITKFNDSDLTYSNLLNHAVKQSSKYNNLIYKPEVRAYDVDDNIMHIFDDIREVPTLLFADPWGYKALPLKIIVKVLQGWGSDCLFFFNYNRLNMAFTNPVFRSNMINLFGEDRALKLSIQLPMLTPVERENLILDETSKMLNDEGISYTRAFRFRSDKNKISHHLIFASKNHKGFEIITNIMKNESSYMAHGIASFEYTSKPIQGLLFDFSIEELAEELLDLFSGQTLRMEQIYIGHSVGRPHSTFTSNSYKKALKKLESEGKVKVDPPSQMRPKRKGEVTFADHVRVTFPVIGV